MSSRWHRVGLYLLSAVVLASCAAPSSSPYASGGSLVPNPSSEAGSADDCEPIDYFTPTGERVDLTGTWRGSFGVHYIRQDGSCVWWVGLEENESEELGARIMVVFRGELGADFTISGEWMSVNRSSFISDRRHGSVTFGIDFGSAGDSETITLRSTLPDAPQGGLGPYAGGVTLVYEGPLPQVPLY